MLIFGRLSGDNACIELDLLEREPAQSRWRISVSNSVYLDYHFRILSRLLRSWVLIASDTRPLVGTEGRSRADRRCLSESRVVDESVFSSIWSDIGCTLLSVLTRTACSTFHSIRPERTQCAWSFSQKYVKDIGSTTQSSSSRVLRRYTRPVIVKDSDSYVSHMRIGMSPNVFYRVLMILELRLA